MLGGEFSITHWLVVLLVVLVVFGTGKLRNAGADLGAAIRGFRKAVAEDDPKPADAPSAAAAAPEQLAATKTATGSGTDAGPKPT